MKGAIRHISWVMFEEAQCEAEGVTNRQKVTTILSENFGLNLSFLEEADCGKGVKELTVLVLTVDTLEAQVS